MERFWSGFFTKTAMPLSSIGREAMHFGPGKALRLANIDEWAKRTGVASGPRKMVPGSVLYGQMQKPPVVAKKPFVTR